MIVVSDNSPLQYLILIDCIDVLPALYGQVLTTPQVMEELSQPQTPSAVRHWLRSPPPWLKIESTSILEFFERIDIGEASAISLAQARCAALVLIDERAGAEAAKRLGIPVVGTLGVLIEAGLENVIDFDEALQRLVGDTSFYASPNLIDSARRLFADRAGKRPVS